MYFCLYLKKKMRVFFLPSAVRPLSDQQFVYLSRTRLESLHLQRYFQQIHDWPVTKKVSVFRSRIPNIWLTWLSRQTKQIIMHCQQKLSNVYRTNLEVGLGVGMIIFVVQSRKVDEHRGVEVTIEVWSSRLHLYVKISLSARDLINRKALDDFGRLSRH